MPSCRRDKGAAHAPYFQTISLVFKLFERLSMLYPRQFATLGSRPPVIRALTCQLSKVSTCLQSLIDRVYALFRPLLLLGRSLLPHQHQDVGRPHQSTRAIHPRLILIVYPTSLTFHIGIRNHRRAYLLVAVGGKLFLKRGQRIQTCCKGGLHFQFVVYKELHILLHSLLVYHTLRIVLIVRVFKLRPRHGLPVHCQQRRVALGECVAAIHEHGSHPYHRLHSFFYITRAYSGRL